jgi:hypothetical protein
MQYLLRLVGAIEVLELSQVLLICTRIPPSHSCRCELYSRYARMLTRTVYCEPSGQLGEFTVEQRPSLGSSSSISDGSHSLAKRRRRPKVLFAKALRRGAGARKSCSPPNRYLGRALHSAGSARNQARSWALHGASPLRPHSSPI